MKPLDADRMLFLLAVLCTEMLKSMRVVLSPLDPHAYGRANFPERDVTISQLDPPFGTWIYDIWRSGRSQTSSRVIRWPADFKGLGATLSRGGRECRKGRGRFKSYNRKRLFSVRPDRVSDRLSGFTPSEPRLPSTGPSLPTYYTAWRFNVQRSSVDNYTFQGRERIPARNNRKNCRGGGSWST